MSGSRSHDAAAKHLSKRTHISRTFPDMTFGRQASDLSVLPDIDCRMQNVPQAVLTGTDVCGLPGNGVPERNEMRRRLILPDEDSIAYYATDAAVATL